MDEHMHQNAGDEFDPVTQEYAISMILSN
eukprot:COSAG05_NODE_1159_length_5667_cov_13.925467_1_plen_28_part_10